MSQTQADRETIAVDREYLAALEFDAYGEKSRGTLLRQREVRQMLDEHEPLTDLGQ